MSAKKLIIIPAFNESANLRRTLEEIRDQAGGSDLLVIDDGSSDSTRQEALRCGVDVISLPINLGIGGAVQTGLIYARDQAYDYVIRLDADGQHDPGDIRRLMPPLEQDEADMVIGSRFIKPMNKGYSPGIIRRAGIGYLSGIVGFITGQRVLDTTSGFCAWDRKAVHLFAERYPVDFPEPESLVLAVRNGLRVKEIPVRMRTRYSGKSSISPLGSIYYLFKVTCALFLMILKRPRRGQP